jgi:DNA-binding transcriptional ArsR family regulator
MSNPEELTQETGIPAEEASQEAAPGPNLKAIVKSAVPKKPKTTRDRFTPEGTPKKAAASNGSTTVTTKSGKTLTVPRAPVKAATPPESETAPVQAVRKPGNIRKAAIKLPDFMKGKKVGLSRAMDQPAIRIKAIADPTRASVLLLLLTNGALNVGELALTLGGISQPALSHHLALLRHARIVEPRRDGKSNYYALTEDIGYPLAESLHALATSM